MEKEKELKVKRYLSKMGFTEEQRDLVIGMIDQACVKLIEDITLALHKKKEKINNG